MARILSMILVMCLCMPLLPARRNTAVAQDDARERTVLTIGDWDDRSANRYDGKDQLGIWQYLEDQLGVEIEYVHLSEGQYETALACGNLPDIVATNNDLSGILEASAAMNVEPYLEEYAPNFITGTPRLSYEVIRQLTSDDKGFYFFPSNIGYTGLGYSNTFFTRGYCVRWDYYKELGCPPINNEDDYLDVLMRMQANHPFTEEGWPTYLYGTDNFMGYVVAFRTEYSQDYWTAYHYHNNIFTNEIYDGYVDVDHSIWWAAAAWQRKLYLAGRDSGAYDMEVFTQTREEYDMKRRRGQYMGLPSSKELLYNTAVAEDSDTISGYCTVPTAAMNYHANLYKLLGNGSKYMWFISASSPHWKEALRLMNYMCDPAFVRECAVGQRGVTWDYNNNGEPQMNEYGKAQMDAFLTGDRSNDNYFYRWGGPNSLPNNWPILEENTLHPDGWPLDFYTLDREYARSTMTSNVSRDMCEVYGVQLPSDAFYEAGGLDFRNDCGEAISACITDLNEEQLSVISDADAILDSVLIDLVFAETDEEFDNIRSNAIQRIIDLGEPEVFRAYQQKWDAAADVVVPLVMEAQRGNGIEPYAPEDYEKLPYVK